MIEFFGSFDRNILQTLVVIYIICYVCFFIYYYGYKIRNNVYFTGGYLEMLPVFGMSFIWPIVIAYIIIATIFKFISELVITIIVEIEELFSKLAKAISKLFKKYKNKK